jgi:prevent-host-death family protein
MKKTLSAMEARKHFGEILEAVHYKGDEFVIERNGKVMGVVIPATQYAQIERDRDRFWDLIDRTQERNKDVPPEVIGKEVEEAIREVRSERRKNKMK